MAKQSTTIATFKRHARKVHPMWNDVRYQADEEWTEKCDDIESKMDALEESMTPEQRESVEEWAVTNGLFGVMGVC